MNISYKNIKLNTQYYDEYSKLLSLKEFLHVKLYPVFFSY